MDFGILTSLELKLEAMTIELSNHQHKQTVSCRQISTRHNFTTTHRGHGRANAGLSTLCDFSSVCQLISSRSHDGYTL